MPCPSIYAIQAAVAERFSVTTLDLVSRRRGQRIARPRQVGYWLARHTTLLSLPEIGKFFGRDHSTVLHGIDRINEAMAREPETRATVRALLKQLQPAEVVA